MRTIGITQKIIPKTLKKIQSSTLYKREIKTTIKIQLEADEVGKKRLLNTMESFNKACNEMVENGSNIKSKETIAKRKTRNQVNES
jgi:DNA-binding HxlR family transcriptional regulator